LEETNSTRAACISAPGGSGRMRPAGSKRFGQLLGTRSHKLLAKNHKTYARDRLIPCCADGEELTNECVGADTVSMPGLRGSPARVKPHETAPRLVVPHPPAVQRRLTAPQCLVRSMKSDRLIQWSRCFSVGSLAQGSTWGISKVGPVSSPQCRLVAVQLHHVGLR
jgi:hypothetical protein